MFCGTRWGLGRCNAVAILYSLFAEAGIRVIESSKISGNRERTVDFRIFRVKLGLVEVVGV